MPRPRKPTRIKILEGTFRPDRALEGEPTPLETLPSPPAWLSERAATLFRETVLVLADMGLASSSDEKMLALLASRLEEVELCTAVIEDGGRFFVSASEVDERGALVSQQIKAHPAVAQRAEAMRHAAILLQQFGLSPAARAKVSAAPKTRERNPFLALNDL